MPKKQALSAAQQATQIQQGNKRALARLITKLENRDPNAQAVLNQLYAASGQAHLIGVTGSPGTGKSTLVTALAQAYRQADKTVAIVAVDPTSPFSGGALLGDRVRMMQLAGDPGIFIRSMANRGHLGGLAHTTNDVVKALDAAGYQIILIETVGAGQSEVEIVQAAQSIIVVEAPGLGDGVQAIKAGILEIADIYVVNKADRPEVGKTVTALRTMLDLGHPQTTQMHHHGILMEVSPPKPASDNLETIWQPPIIQTIASTGAGIPDLIAALADHYQYLIESDLLQIRDQNRLLAETETRLKEQLFHHILTQLPQADLASIREKILKRQLTPQAAAEHILKTVDKAPST